MTNTQKKTKKHSKKHSKILLKKTKKYVKNNNLIIHISGCSGAGKTTLGEKLLEKFSDKIIVKDLDNLRSEFLKEEYKNKKMDEIKKEIWNEGKYQQWIDNYIDKNKDKPIVLVGLNSIPWVNKFSYYNMHSKHNFYINLDFDTIFKQRCSRFMDNIFVKNREKVLDNIIKNKNKEIKNIQDMFYNNCNYDEILENNKQWNKDYKEQKYKFMSREYIYEKVSKILNKAIK